MGRPEYHQRNGTNKITPYICGSEYLPAFKAALENERFTPTR